MAEKIPLVMSWIWSSTTVWVVRHELDHQYGESPIAENTLLQKTIWGTAVDKMGHFHS